MHTFKSKTSQNHCNWFLIDSSSLANQKEPVYRTQSSQSSKVFPKDAIDGYICKFTKFQDQKIHVKI